MGQIKETCSSLSTLLHMIRDKKADKENDVPDTLIADAMALFAQLSGQHHALIKDHEADEERISELQEKCELAREEFDEQQSYINYLNTEYDVSPWTSEVLNNQDLSTESHLSIKAKLDQELLERRQICEQGKSIEDEVSALRAAEEANRAELERVKSLMVAMPTPAFLSGISPCADIPTPVSLPSPLYTLHHLASATLREQQYNGLSISVTSEDPLQSTSSMYNGRGTLTDLVWDKVASDPQLIVLKISNNTLVFRYHSKMNIVSVDHDLAQDKLDEICSGDTGVISPHTSLNFMFTNPSLTEIISGCHLGRVYCWLQELCGLDVITVNQRHPSKLTIPAFLHHLSNMS